MTYSATNNPNGATISTKLALGAADRTFNVGDSTAAASDLSISGIISGGTGIDIIKTGAGTMTLSGVNTYTGSTTINGGTVRIAADSGLGVAPAAATAGSLTLNGGTLETTATMTLSSNRGIALGAGGGTFDIDAGTTLTYAGIVAGSGSFTKTDTGTMTLSGTANNTFNGALNVNDGTLNLNKSSGVNAYAGTAVTVGDNIGAAASANLVIQANNQLSNMTKVTVNSDGKLALTSAVTSQSLSQIAGTGQIDLATSSALTVGADNSNSTFAGTLTGGGTLNKAGGGNLTLSGTVANSHTGTVNVNGGTLSLGKTAGVDAMGSGALNIGASASVKLLASDQINDASVVTIAATGVLGIGSFSETLTSIAGAGTVTVGAGGNLTLTDVSAGFTGTLNLDNATLTLDGATLGGGAKLKVTGASVIDFGGSSTLNLSSLDLSGATSLTIKGWTGGSDYFYDTGTFAGTTINQLPGSGELAKIIFDGYGPSTTPTGWRSWSTPGNQISPVPEPSTYGLILIGASIGFVVCRRKRKPAAAA